MGIWVSSRRWVGGSLFTPDEVREGRVLFRLRLGVDVLRDGLFVDPRLDEHDHQEEHVDKGGRDAEAEVPEAFPVQGDSRRGAGAALGETVEDLGARQNGRGGDVEAIRLVVEDQGERAGADAEDGVAENCQNASEGVLGHC